MESNCAHEDDSERTNLGEPETENSNHVYAVRPILKQVSPQHLALVCLP